MKPIQDLWQKLDLRQKISMGAALVAVLAGLYYFVQWNHERNFQMLFSNLAAEDAGLITTRLRERGIEFRLNSTGNGILVPTESVAELRLELAGEGIPKSGRIGFELFDKTNLTATDFQEKVNYHRALEGELERSIMSIADVESARVHVTFAKESVFTESRQPAKASVMLKLRPGGRVSPQSVQAMTHLLASAVETLQPEAVSVLDTNGTVLSRPKKILLPDGSEPDDAQIEYRQKIERDLLQKVHTTLQPVLGEDHYRASVTSEIDFSSGEQSEESFDPTRSVMSSQQRTEDLSGAAQAAGIPGTPSALPRPLSRPGETGKTVSRRTENIAYQSSRVVKRVRLPQGTLRRISISVLLDQELQWQGTGADAKRILVAPDAEKIKKISDLVAGATGLQQQRGDQIIVESVPFDATLRALPPEIPDISSPSAESWPEWIPAPLRDMSKLSGIAVAVFLIVVIALFLLTRKKKEREALPAPNQQAFQPVQAAVSTAAQLAEDQIAQHAMKTRELEAEAQKLLEVPDGIRKGEVLARLISEQATKDPSGMAVLIRNWVQEDPAAR